MQRIACRIQRFLNSEDGPTAVEYAIMLALIVMVCFAAIMTMGTKTNTIFVNTAASMNGS